MPQFVVNMGDIVSSKANCSLKRKRFKMRHALYSNRYAFFVLMNGNPRSSYSVKTLPNKMN